MPLIPYPNVPLIAGVPSLPRLATGSQIVRLGIGILSSIIWQAVQADNTWGIFDKSGKALGISNDSGLIASVIQLSSSYQSTVSFAYGKEVRVSDFPIERGSFASFNKVESPAQVTVPLSLSGNDADRNQFLQSIDAATKSTELYDCATPDSIYIDYSITGYNYERAATSGANLLLVNITLQEVRSVSAAFSVSQRKIKQDAAKNPSAEPTIDSGRVQSQNPTDTQSQVIKTKTPWETS